MLNICVPVLKRYDLLQKMVISLRDSTLRPDNVWVINNGFDQRGIRDVKAVSPVPVVVHTPNKRMGVAESWNWFIQNVPEERVLVNDDIEFTPTVLEEMCKATTPFVSCGVGFSCFIIRDKCIEMVGEFDEEISPGYAYFEDCDYRWRMKDVGAEDTTVEATVVHHGSQTVAVNTPDEENAHYEKFKLAQSNFIKKWGKLPPGLQPVL